MKTRLAMLIGLPGSGKTHWINAHIDDYELIFDDLNRDSLPDALKAIGVVKSMIIADPHLCVPENLSKAMELFNECEIEEVYFENNPTQCKLNVLHRNDGRRVDGLIDMYAKLYHPPTNAIPVWDGNSC